MTKIHLYGNGKLLEIWESEKVLAQLTRMAQNIYSNVDIYVEPELTDAQKELSDYLISEGLTTTSPVDEEELIVDILEDVSTMRDDECYLALEKEMR